MCGGFDFGATQCGKYVATNRMSAGS